MPPFAPGWLLSGAFCAIRRKACRRRSRGSHPCSWAHLGCLRRPSSSSTCNCGRSRRDSSCRCSARRCARADVRPGAGRRRPPARCGSCRPWRSPASLKANISTCKAEFHSSIPARSRGSRAMKFAHFSHIWGMRMMTPHQRYEQLWRELEACDALGFDYGFCVEHHFRPDESWISSPSLYAVGAGARTRRMRIGPMGYVVPLYHPLRLAEEIAIVDQMLGGRMELGLVPGINADYFKPFGLDYNLRKSPTLEFVDYLRAAYGEKQPFSFHGQEFHTDRAEISVQPLQRPHPPIWMMNRDPQTLEFCASHAINPGYFLVYPRSDARRATPSFSS